MPCCNQHAATLSNELMKREITDQFLAQTWQGVLNFLASVVLKCCFYYVKCKASLYRRVKNSVDCQMGTALHAQSFVSGPHQQLLGERAGYTLSPRFLICCY